MNPPTENRWLLPLPSIWLVGTGALAALLVALVAWGLVALVRPRAAAELRASLRDGFLGPLAWLLGVASLLAVVITLANLAVPAVPIAGIARSLARMMDVDTGSLDVSVPAGGTSLEIPLDLVPQELETLDVESVTPLVVRTQQALPVYALASSRDHDTPWSWRRDAGTANPFVGEAPLLEAVNDGTEPVEMKIRWRLRPEFPQAAILPWSFLVLTVILAAYAVFRLGASRLAAIAAATTKEAIGQPIFAVVLVAGMVALWIFTWIPYNTFGQDVKMFKDCGITLVKILALLVVVWTASVAVAEEIEGRTALTVLSKPLRRWQFVLGKFAGLVLVATLVFLILGGGLLAATTYKEVYDAREGAREPPPWTACADEMVTVVPGLALALLETVLMASVTLAISTRLGLVPNLVVSFAVYACGHLVPLIVQSSVGRFALVRFTGRLFAVLLPVLDHFTIEAAVIGGVPVPWSYLAWTALYAALYATVALLVALVLFQDRDLA